MRFRLAAPPSSRSRSPPATTEIGTLRTASDESTVFQVSERFAIPPARPAAYVVQRGGRYKTIAVAGGTAKPQGPDRLPFGSPPQVDDALYLGFDEDISDLLLQVEIDGRTARGAGVDPEDPPLRWEVSQGGDGGPRPRCCRTAPAASTTAPGSSSCSARRTPAVVARRATACAGCAAGSTT